MGRLTMVACIIMLSGCQSVYVAIGVHPPGLDAPEHFAPNPVGAVGAETIPFHKVTGFCEHISSIPYYEDGYGFNWCGVRREFTFR